VQQWEKQSYNYILIFTKTIDSFTEHIWVTVFLDRG